MSTPSQNPPLVPIEVTSDLSASELVDRLCVEQRTRWLEGDPVQVMTLLEQYPRLESDRHCVFELVYSEYLLRHELGESPSLDEFSQRYPDYEELLRRQLEFREALGSDVSLIARSSKPDIGTPHAPLESEEIATNLGSADSLDHGQRFVVLHRLGVGAMGVVYAAFDNLWQQTVALKMPRNVDATTILHIKQEFRVLADLTHPNLIQLFELFSAKGGYFLTMELIDGVDFVSHCRDQGHNGEAVDDGFARLFEALRQLTKGLNTLHQAGCLHCDIKPSNVLVTETGRVVLLDFGLAERRNWSELTSEADSYVRGTAAYIAPEQLAGSGASVASDWYSVGVVLYQVLTGRLPFGGTFSEVLAAKRSAEPQAPAELVGGIPDGLNSLCVGLLRRDPKTRPSGEDVWRQLSPNSRDQKPRFDSGTNVAEKEPFVGREQELAQLRDSLRLVNEQREPVIHFVCGDSGVGKTSLVRRFVAELAERQDVLVLAGRCYEQESVRFKALDSLIDDISQYLRRLPADEVRRLLPADIEALTRMFPVLGCIKTVSLPGPTEITDQQQLRIQAQRTLRALLCRIAEQRCLVLCLDDLQWGDVDSAELLAELLFARNAPPLLLLGCHRSVTTDENSFLSNLQRRWSAAARRLEWRELKIDDLPFERSRELAQRLIAANGDIHSQPAEEIARESGGNPFLICELVRFANWSNQHNLSGSRSAGTNIDDILCTRIGQLPFDVRRLLEIISVAGHPMSRQDALRATKMLTDQQKAVAILRAGHFVQTHRIKNEPEQIEPYHDRIRECVVRSLPADVASAHHLQLALALEAGDNPNAERLAKHYYAAGRATRACEQATIAAEQAAAALAFDQAATLFRLALKTHAGTTAERGSLHRRLGDVLASAGLGFEAAQEYLQVLELRPTENSSELRRLAAAQLLRSGHFDEGFAVLESLLNAAGLTFPKTPLRALIRVIGLELLIRLRRLRRPQPHTGEFAPAQLERVDLCWTASQITVYDMLRFLPLTKRHALLALKVGEPDHIAIAFANTAVPAAMAGARRANHAAKLMATARSYATPGSDPWVHGYLDMSEGITALLQGRWRRTDELCSRADPLFRRSSQAVWLEADISNNFRSMALFFLGRLRELAEQVPVLVDEADKRGDAYAGSVFRMGCMNVAWLVVDDPQRARDEITKAGTLWPMLPYSFHQIFEAQATLNLQLYLQDGRAAWDSLKQRWPALKTCGGMRIAFGRTIFQNFRACCALAAVRDGGDSRPLLRVAARAARKLTRERFNMAPCLARLIRAQIAVYRGDTTQAVDELRTAAAEFDTIEMALYAAVARKRCGELIGGDEGRELIEAADAFMAEQDIKNPTRMAAMLAPTLRSSFKTQLERGGRGWRLCEAPVIEGPGLPFGPAPATRKTF